MVSAGGYASGQSGCARPPALAARLKSHPTTQAWADLGNWYGEHNQFACAQSAFRSALQSDPKSAQINYLLGLSLYGSRRFEEALAPLRRSAEAAPDSVRTHLLLASIYSQLNRPQEAIPEWQAALKIDPHSSMGIHGLTRSLVETNDYAGVVDLLQPRKKLDTDSVNSLAIAEYRVGKYQEAIETAMNGLKTAPSSVPLGRTLVLLYLKTARTDAAEVAAKKCYELNPKSLTAQATYFQTLVVNGDWGPARPLGKKLLAEAPHSFDTLYDNGVLESQTGDYPAAKEHLLAAAAIRPRMANLRYSLGLTLNHLQDYADAKKQLELAIQLGAEETEVHFELAKSLSHLGDTAGARQQLVLYQQAVRDKQNSVIATSKSAEADEALKQNNVKHAVELLTQAFNATPNNALLGYKLSTTQDLAGDFAGESATLQKVVRLDPQSAHFNYLLGLSFYKLEKDQEAVAPLSRSIQIDPSVMASHLLLASVYSHLSKPQLAIPEWQAALNIDPNSTMAVHGLTQSLFETNDYAAVVGLLQWRKGLDTDSVNNLAIAEYRTDQPLEAIQTATDGLKSDPTSIDLSRTLMLLYLKMARDDQAEATAKRCYELNPKSLAAQAIYFQTLVVNGEWGPARDVGKKLLAEAPHSFEALYDNGVLESQTGDYVAAKEHLVAAAALRPNVAEPHYYLGITLVHLRDYAGAKQQLELAIQFGAQHTEAHFQLAQALSHLGDTVGARQQLVLFQQAVKDKENATLASNKVTEAAEALKQNNVKHAVELLSEAFNATPKDELLGYKLATAQGLAGDTEAERATLQKVVKLDSSFSLAQYQLGYLDSQRGDLTGAETHFGQAVQDAPDYVQAWISLSATLATESKFPEAMKAVDSALRLDPTNAEAQGLKKQLVGAQATAADK